MTQVKECFNLLGRAYATIRDGLTEREKLAFQAGLRAAHAEEALAQGDIQRAEAHFSHLLQLGKRLKG